MTREPDEDLVDAAIARLEKEELERVKKLSAAEVAKELRERGLAPDAGAEVARRALAAAGKRAGGGGAADEDLVEAALDRLEREEKAQAQAQAHAQAQAQAQAEAQAQAQAKSGGRKAPAKVIPLYARVAAAATLLGPAGYLALNQSETLTLVASGPDGGGESLEAEALRSEAANALEAGQWARCIALLDEAKKRDPKGDLAPAVQDVRRIALRKLGRVDASGPD